MEKRQGSNALFIINKKSGKTNFDITSARNILQKADISLIEYIPDDLSTIPDFIRSQASQADMVILGGGDGTISLSLNALMEMEVPLGILPLGTANDLAKTLNIEEDIEHACRVITDKNIRSIDVASVEDKYYLNVAHIGLGAKVKNYISTEEKKYFGVFEYLRSITDAFKSNSPFIANITCDGDLHEFETIHISVGNGRHYGGGMTVEENASISDQRLNVFALAPQSFPELGALAYFLRTGKFDGLDRITQFNGTKIKVQTPFPKQITADGEYAGQTPCVFEVLPDSLKVYAPDT